MPALPVDETIAFKVSKPLLSLIDKAAGGNFANRSEYIRAAVVTRLRADGVCHAVTNEYPSTDKEQKAVKRLPVNADCS